jgi:Immunity protein 35
VMNDLVEATAIVMAYLRSFAEPGDGLARLALVSAELREAGWVFTYTSRAFLESRSFLDALGGNCPLLVRHDGSIVAVPFSENLDQVAGLAVCA